MKKVIRITSLIILAAFAITLAGCSKTTVAPADSAASMLQADYDAADAVLNDVNVTGNLALPATGANGSTITWTSSDTTVISNDGVLVNANGLYFEENGSLNIYEEDRSATMTGVMAMAGTEETKTITFVATIKAPDSKSDANLIIKAYSAIMTKYEGNALEGYTLDMSGAEKAYTLAFIAYEGVTIAYTDTASIKFDGTNATITRPTDSASVTETLSIKLTVNSTSVDVTVPIIITKDDAAYLTIAEVRDLIDQGSSVYEGNTYVYSGTITEKLEDGTFFIQEDGEALEIYNYTGDTVTEVGDYVLITSQVTNYSGLYETASGTIENVQILVKAADNTARIAEIETLVLTEENFNSTALKGKDNVLSSAANLIYLSATSLVSGSSPRITVGINGIDVTAVIYVNKYADDYTEMFNFFNTLKVGEKFNLKSCTLGWYVSVPQINVNMAESLEKISGTISSNQKATYELNKLTFPENFTVGDTHTLTTVGATFTDVTITWAATDAKAEIADGVLTINSTEAFTFSITATVKCGVATKTKTFENIPVTAPISITEMMTAVDASNPVVGELLQGQVIAVGKDGLVLSDGTHSVLVSYPSSLTAPKEGSNVAVVISAVAKTGGIYNVTISAVAVDDEVSAIVAGEFTSLEAIAALETVNLQKVILKNATIADGGATSGSKTFTFIDNATGTAFADGQYDYVEGVIVASSSTNIAFYVTSTWDSIAKAIAAGETNTDTWTFRGLNVLRTGADAPNICDEEGNVIAAFNTGISDEDIFSGTYIQITGTLGSYSGLLQLNISSAVNPDLYVVEVATAYEYLAAMKANATVVTDTSTLTEADKGKYFVIEGLKYVSGDYGQLTSSSNKSVTFEDANGNEFVLYMQYAAGVETENAFSTAIASAVANSAGYTISVYGSFTIYNELYELYPCVESVVLTPVA